MREAPEEIVIKKEIKRVPKEVLLEKEVIEEVPVYVDNIIQ